MGGEKEEGGGGTDEVDDKCSIGITILKLLIFKRPYIYQLSIDQ